MRTTLMVISLITTLLLPGAVWTAETPAKMPAQEPSEDGHQFDSCYGDRYESDQQLNEGNEISDQELINLIRALNGPGV